MQQNEVDICQTEALPQTKTTVPNDQIGVGTKVCTNKTKNCRDLAYLKACER